MPSRVVRLPPLENNSKMIAKGLQTFDNHVGPVERPKRSFSRFKTSNPKIDENPIDFVLVYNPLSPSDEDKKSSTTPSYPPEARRAKYEEYLKKKQDLELENHMNISKTVAFVKIHTPFDVLLRTAEAIRMRLPIEKIEPIDDSTVKVRSCWGKFTLWLKKPFYLDRSLTNDEPDYYTAVYSSKTTKFAELFDTLRGSRNAYFTASERSLLTYELLNRVYFNMKNNDQIAAGVGQTVGLKSDESKPKGKWQGIDRLVAKQAYARYFPLHEPLRDNVTDVPDNELNDREKLKKHWATMRKCLKFQPLSLIRSYMGEKVAFYFALSGFYNQMLLPASLVGLIVFIYGAGSVSTDQSTTDICGSFGNNTYMCPRCDKACPLRSFKSDVINVTDDYSGERERKDLQMVCHSLKEWPKYHHRKHFYIVFERFYSGN